MKRRYYTRMTRKGQVTVPADVRREMALQVGDLVSFLVDNGEVTLEPPGSFTARTKGIFKSDLPPMSDVELDKAINDAWAEAAIARDERTKSY